MSVLETDKPMSILLSPTNCRNFPGWIITWIVGFRWDGKTGIPGEKPRGAEKALYLSQNNPSLTQSLLVFHPQIVLSLSRWFRMWRHLLGSQPPLLTPIALIRHLRSNDADGNENVKKTIGFYKQYHNLARASRFFVYFFTRFCTTTTWKCPISLFMEYVNKQQRNFISLSELGLVPRNSTPGGFAYIWQSKWVGIIAINTERKQIHFLSDVLVIVASLDFKVPNSWSARRQ